MEEKAKKPLPFHEAIVAVIAKASNAEMFALARLLLLAKVPKGHALIIAAWEKRRHELDWNDDDLGVGDGLRRQEARSLLEAARNTDCKCGGSGCQENGREHTCHP